MEKSNRASPTRSRSPRPGEPAAISDLQRSLQQLSRSDPRFPRVPVDGVYGSVTRDAVSRFQKTHNLPVTGTADQTTWYAIAAADRLAAKESANPSPVCFFPANPANYELCMGDENNLVWIVQLLLRELLLLDGESVDTLDVDGRFGARTENAVKKYQSIRLLPVTGRVNAQTWNRLAEEQTARTINGVRE